jgi:glycine/D-amino acid oxidase-like deaminating enzyme
VQHFWRCPHPIESLPLIKNDKAVFLRPEGEGFVGGRPSWEVEPGFTRDIGRGYFADYFERTVWPLLAEIVPKFEQVRLERSWAGHYSQNLFDGNMILGAFAPGLDNLLVACGFSGHGVMHAPAVGRALAELALDGEFRTLDLSRMGFRRVLEDAPYGEEGIR